MHCAIPTPQEVFQRIMATLHRNSMTEAHVKAGIFIKFL